MADNIWDNSDTDNDGNNANNWSLGTVPSGTDVMVFDSATTSDNCTFTGNISCAGMRFDNTYTGTVDADTFDMTFTGDVVCSNGGSATINMGSGTWEFNTTGGNFDYEDIGTMNPETSTLLFSSGGGGSHVYYTDGSALYNMTINANTTVTLWRGSHKVTNNFTCAGTLDFRNSMDISFDGNVSITGSLTPDQGNNDVSFNAGSTLTNFTGGSISGGTVNFYQNVTLPSGNYTVDSDTVNIRNTSTVASDSSMTWPSGEWTFNGAVYIEQNRSSGGYTYTLDMSAGGKIIANGSTLDFEGDDGSQGVEQLVIIDGNFKITGSTQLTYGGNVDGSINIGAVEVDGTNLTLTDDLTCTSFTGTSNSTGMDLAGFDLLATEGDITFASGYAFNSAADTMNGSTISARGIVTFNGQHFNATAAWYVNSRGGRTVFSGSGDIEYCTAQNPGIKNFYADGWTDTGNNTNITFSAEPTFSGGLRRRLEKFHPYSLWNGCVGAWSPSYQRKRHPGFIRDYSGYGHHLYMLSGNNDPANWIYDKSPGVGRGGWSHNLQGSSDGLSPNSDHQPHLALRGDVTISIWIKRRSATSGMSFCSFGHTNTSTSPEVEAENNLWWLSQGAGGDITWAFEYSTGTNESSSWNSNMNLDQWYHILATRDDTAKTMNVWVDDFRPSSEHSYSNSPTGGTVSNFYIGEDPPNSQGNYDGQWDSCAVWNRVLSKGERECLYYYGRDCMYRPVYRPLPSYDEAATPGTVHPWFYRRMAANNLVG